MVFSSVIFLFGYLPLVLAGYHLVFRGVRTSERPAFWRRASNLYLLLVSLVFYFWGEGWLVWIIGASTLIDYLCGLLIVGGHDGPVPMRLEKGGPRSPRQRFGVTLSVVSNLCFLGYFKYFNFGVDSFNAVAPEAWRLTGVAEIALPLGISFYTFQSMSYTIDVYRGHVKATRNLIDFASYVTIFPQLVAGPIVRYADVATQLVERSVDLRLFASGVERFVTGLAKKVLVANTVAQASDLIFSLPVDQLTTPLAWLGLLAYTLQIYFDFSGYSDMAIGLGRMLGFRFPENFDYPYIARSVSEFWRRWHISLSTWFRDYLFIPLGGSRCSRLRSSFNLWTVFFLCGLWHGASALMVIWGMYHGLVMVLEKTPLGQRLGRLPLGLSHAYALLAVMLGWPMFAGSELDAVLGYYRVLFVPQEPSAYLHVQEYFAADVRLALVAGILFSMPVAPHLGAWVRRAFVAGSLGARGLAGARVLVLMVALLLCGMSLAAGTHNPFIYFRF